MKANDFCRYCNAALTDENKRGGACPACGEHWDVAECEMCGEHCDRDGMYRDGDGDLMCEDCAREIGEIF